MRGVRFRGNWVASEKTSGMHRCIPDRSESDVKKLISSSLLSSLQPSYSPLRSSRFSPAWLAERVINLMYKDCAHYCQEESECDAQNLPSRIGTLSHEIAGLIARAQRGWLLQRRERKRAFTAFCLSAAHLLSREARGSHLRERGAGPKNL